MFERSSYNFEAVFEQNGPELAVPWRSEQLLDCAAACGLHEQVEPQDVCHSHSLQAAHGILGLL